MSAQSRLRRRSDLDWTLGALIDRRAAEHGDRIALRAGDGTALSYAELAERVAGVRTLLAERGLGVGDRVGLMLGNTLRYPVAWLGVVSAGMVAVPVNKRSGPVDARHQFDDGRVSLVLADDGTRDGAAAAAAGSDRDITIERVTGEGWPHRPASPAASIPPAALANIQYTSGTTGLPKGCALSHRYWQYMGQAAVDLLELTGASVLLTAQPFSYIDPLWNTAAALRAGAELVVLDGFHPSTFMRDVARFGVTVFYCLATMPVLLLRQPEAPHDRDHRLERVSCSAIPPQVHAELERRWGVPWSEVYGMTETGLNIAVLDEDHDALVGSGSLGTVLAHCEARVVDPDGSDVREGEVGELLLRGLGMMDGYVDDPAATTAFFADGWAHTGDLVVRDAEGRLMLRGRRRDMIRRAGENVAAAQVEAALVTHPLVLECAVVAEPDDVVGEELRALVVATTDGDGPPAASDLHAYLTERLASFKVPRFWEFRDALPHTPSERVAKHELGPPDGALIDLSPRAS
ncbi:MAG TPA: AMP-binding protein [Euzebyales bacterium]